MKWLKKQWELFKSKSAFGKFFDVLFLVIIILLIVPEGRMMFQRAILKTGLFGSTNSNSMEKLSTESLNWKLQNAEGQIISIAELQGKPVFINFWATWCPPCRAEMPSIISLMDQIGDKAIFLFITSEEPTKVNTFLKKNGWDIPVYYMLEQTPSQLAAKSLPTSIVLNSTLEIIHRSEGMRNWDNSDAIKLLTQ